MKSMQPIICLSYSSHIVFLFSCLVIFLSITTTSAFYDGNETDQLPLLSFKSMINHDPNGALTSWNISLHFCKWSGVTCGKRRKRVTYVEMNSQGLEGSLSPHVGNLSFLRGLSLGNNSFQGIIPHELGRLSSLLFLYLDQNKFEGVIPANLSGCSNLEELYLSYNQLVGSIPKEIGFLLKLTIVAIHYNNFIGGIPPFFGNLTSLQALPAAGNPFGGSIPDTFGNLKSLSQIACSSCNLFGTIPHSIYNLSLLSILSFSTNHLSGSLVSTIGSRLPHLAFLQLNENNLSGPVPPSISNCSKLTNLAMDTNNFSGKLTIDFSKLTNINRISMIDNDFGSGDVDEMKFIDSLKNCSKLSLLLLMNCNFQGILLDSIGNLSNQLGYLNLARNQLYGNLPSSLGNLVGLNTLYLTDNRLTGKIPSTIGKLKKLQLIHLDGNNLSGLIPDEMGNLSLLNTLSLTSNRLNGPIPLSLGNCHHLIELYLNDNKLSGTIPKQLLQLSSLSISLDLSQNNLSGSLPAEIGELTTLGNLDLSDNNLSGNIPSSLCVCTSLTHLSIRGNLFQGIIPLSLSSLRGLLKLDLSQNNLSGKIPRFLDQLSLEYMNLSYNNFEGELPVLGVFTNASEFSVIGNNMLCGGLIELGLPKCKEMKKDMKNRFPLFIIVIMIAFTLFTILCFVYAWCKMKRMATQSQSSTNRRFLKVSYNQLRMATDGFSEANLIGKGGFSSVYKGTLDHDDKVVAVKVLCLENRGAHRSFIAECEARRSIRHRNLLKIITSCSSVDFQGNDFKALVSEFMPNGSLHDWLHLRARTSRLNLLQRINIIFDVASALHYLHNRCLTTIVHCDLKPSNILLDDDMVAHVGDFGLARFLGTNSNQNSSTGVKGTIGYTPPEYGMGGEMTSSGDVYSFGILLLEVMTGKSPTNDIFNNGLSLHKFAYMALPNHVTDVIDNDVIVLQSTEANTKKLEECLSSVVKIGVSCCVDSPPQRMNIENVVQELQHILDVLQNI